MALPLLVLRSRLLDKPDTLPLSPFFNRARVRNGFHAMMTAVEACHRFVGINSQESYSFLPKKKKMWPSAYCLLNLMVYLRIIFIAMGWNPNRDYCDIFFVFVKWTCVECWMSLEEWQNLNHKEDGIYEE